jgi:hypothetical protein
MLNLLLSEAIVGIKVVVVFTIIATAYRQHKRRQDASRQAAGLAVGA